MQSKQASKWWWCDVGVRLLATGEGCSSFIHMQSLIRIAWIVFAINSIKCQIEARTTWRIESKSVLTHFTSCSLLWNEWQVRWVKTLFLSTHHMKMIYHAVASNVSIHEGDGILILVGTHDIQFEHLMSSQYAIFSRTHKFETHDIDSITSIQIVNYENILSKIQNDFDWFIRCIFIIFIEYFNDALQRM